MVAAVVVWVGRLRWWVDVGKSANPVIASSCSAGRRTACGRLMRRTTPWRPNRSCRTGGLVGLWMNICRLRCALRAATATAARTEKLETSLDVRVTRVELCCSLICIEGVGDLIIAGFVQSAEIVPHFGDVRVEANGTRVGIQGITILVDLVVQHTNRAPERGVLAITVHGLLVCLVRFWVLLLGHVASAEEIPALGILVIS